MPTLLESCEELFGTRNIYEVLDIGKDATEKEVKRGYFKLSLQVHPDRVGKGEKEAATQKFQILGRVYHVLGDKDMRGRYDETGEVDDDIDTQESKDWSVYWRILFKKVSVEDIKDFEKKYQGSDEELQDLRSTYIEFEGDMEQILENVLCSSYEDEPRFRDILQGLIDDGELPAFEAFTDELEKNKLRRLKKAKLEQVEAEELARELGIGEVKGDASLQAMIKQREQSREQQKDSFLADLEAKYSKAKPKKTKSATKKNKSATKKK